MIYPFQIQIERFQNVLNKAEVGCLNISNGLNTKVSLQESNHLLSVKGLK